MRENIKKYISEKYISFHTPAHKGRNKYINKILKPCYDLTELSETDNLFCPEGCIKELEDSLKADFDCKEFHILVNGATSGMMAVASLFTENDKVLVDRNCHISVLNGFIHSGATPVFINTALNEFNIPLPPTLENIEEAYNKNPDAKAVIITSPNYYGLKAELKKISRFCKGKNIITIADEAHGSHFYYFDKNETAVGSGFDISVVSFHKNLPGLTQTGAMLVNNPMLTGLLKEKIRKFTSTSPSYILMLSFDAVREYMSKNGKKALKKIFRRASKLRKRLLKNNIKVLDNNDDTRLVINCRDADKRAEDIKIKYKTVCEMCDSSNITFILSMHNTKKELEILEKAIMEFTSEPDLKKEEFILPEMKITPSQAVLSSLEEISVEASAGRISGEYIINFPPSVPIIVPGEIITEDLIKKINRTEIKCVRE